MVAKKVHSFSFNSHRRNFLFCFVLMLFANFVHAQTPSFLDGIRKITRADGGVSGRHQDGKLVLIGDISNVESLVKLMQQYKDAKELYIDSANGEVESARILLKTMQERKITLVVDGKCFSVCASILFVGANTKKVLTNSLVAISDRTQISQLKNAPPEFKKLMPSAVVREAHNVAGVAIKENGMDLFYQSLKINTEMFEKFNTLFVETKNASTGKCRNIKAWALNMPELKELNVGGIKEFWFPKNHVEKRELFKHIQSSEEGFFIGGFRKFNETCLQGK